MRFFEQKFSVFLLFITIPLLFLPKINLISLDAEETAGLRLDDIILFFFGSLLMWSHALSNQKLYKIEGFILLITFFSLFSFLLNRILVSHDLLYSDAKIFYVFRLLEYFLFFYIGVMASSHMNGRAVLKAFFIWNILLMVLQKFAFAGAVGAGGYHDDVSGRVQGIASFPSEMGLLLNLLFCFMIFDENTSSRFLKFFPSSHLRYLLQKFYPYWMFCLFGLFVIFTGNRISILALTIAFLVKLKDELKTRSIGPWIISWIMLPLLLVGIAIIITQTAGVYRRSFELFSYKNLELVETVWDEIDLNKEPIGNQVISSKEYDVSWWLRIHKWLFALKSYLYTPACYLQGLGPGFCGAALDGGLLRILTEYGVIGVFLFWKFFASLYHINRQTKWMMISFLINMIFFDAYLAYKTMSLLLFSSGYLFDKTLFVSSRNKPAIA